MTTGAGIFYREFNRNLLENRKSEISFFGFVLNSLQKITVGGGFVDHSLADNLSKLGFWFLQGGKTKN